MITVDMSLRGLAHACACALVLACASAGVHAQSVFRLLPGDGEPAGWTRVSDPKLYSRSQLYQYIDGGAEVYLDHGYVQVATAELGCEKRRIIADVYEMGSADGAFGIYAAERPAAPHIAQIGCEAWTDAGALRFWLGKYYVKLSAEADDAKTRRGLDDMARIIARKIGGSRSLPAPLSLLPAAGREPHTEQHAPRSFLDRSELKDTWSAAYRRAGKSYTLFITITSAPALAQTAARALRSVLSKPGSSDAAYASLGGIVVTGRHREAGELVAVVKGRYLVGAFPATDAALMRTVLQEALAKLR